MARRPRPGRRHRRLEVGLHLHRRLAGRRRPAGGQGPRHRHARAPDRRDPRAARRPTRPATRSTPRRWRPACSRTAPCSTALAELRAEGVAIGFTTSGPGQADTIRRALEVGGFDTVQSTWNLHERSAEAALAEAHDAGLQVIVKEALANGRLTDREPDPRPARGRTRAGDDVRCGGARRGARAALVDRRAERRVDGADAGVEPRGDATPGRIPGSTRCARIRASTGPGAPRCPGR